MVEDVVYGCTMTVGEQAMNIGRNAALAAGFPDTVPGTTVDRQCGSAQQAVHFAAQAVVAGAMDVVDRRRRRGHEPGAHRVDHRARSGRRLRADRAHRFDFIHQGLSAEEIAARWQIGREEMDRFALRSHDRAARAIAEGRFDGEIVPLAPGGPASRTRWPQAGTDEGDPADEGPLAFDEGVRAGSTYEKLASLPPCLHGGRAGHRGQLVPDLGRRRRRPDHVRGAGRSQLGLRPRARFHTFAVAANDPVIMLTAPIPATTLVLEKAKLSLDDIDLIEINEAFASVVLAWEKEHHPDMEQVNVNGGAIAIGHPTGGSGARLLGHPAQRDGAHRRPATGSRRCARVGARPTPPSSSGWARPPRRCGRRRPARACGQAAGEDWRRRRASGASPSTAGFSSCGLP